MFFRRRDVRALMKQVKPVIPARFTSKNFQIDAINKALGFGVFVNLDVLNSPYTIFPSTFHGLFGGKIMNKEIDIFEVCSTTSSKTYMYLKIIRETCCM